MSKRKTVTVVDADTGNEIVAFIRRGRCYMYLRHPQTKRFIKRLKKVELRIFKVLDYDVKAHPIYADFSARWILSCNELMVREKAERDIEDAIDLAIQSKFGKGLRDLSEYAGLEYGSRLIGVEDVTTFDAVWKHRKKAKPRKRRWLI